MKWEKLGRIYTPSGHHDQLVTHASNPLAYQLTESIFRVYYSGRNQDNKSSVGYFDFDMRSFSVVDECTEPLLVFGEEGSFYSHGISIGNLYEDSAGAHILFMGWQIRGDDHWRGDIGKINVINPGKLEIDDESPFMSVDNVDPISLSYPWVEPKSGGGFDMWYGSTITWKTGNGEMIHVINHASSQDGTTWRKTGLAIPYEINKAQAFSRPVYWSDGYGEHMLFSYRSGMGEKYRIGYSKRVPGEGWKLALEDTGIDIGGDGEWDSEMICYPFVFNYLGEKYMLYNGNGHGKSGVGLAKLKGR